MNETELDTLLQRSSRRLRFLAAFRAAIAALAIGAVLLSALVFGLRFRGYTQSFAQSLLVLPILALLVLCVRFQRFRLMPAQIAMLLDKLGKTDEHLVTWHELRSIPDDKLSELQRGYRTAQRDQTLLRAEKLNPRRLLPFRLPAWTRAIWLALLLLCCALLMPPQKPKSALQVPQVQTSAPGEIVMGNPAVQSPAASNAMPRVQVLSPTEFRRFELLATDQRMPAAVKAGVLKELQNKIGAIPESELAPEVRELLDMLRKETGANKSAANDPGSTQSRGAGESEPTQVRSPTAAQFNITEFNAKALTTLRENFSDVQEPLERYYKQYKE